MNFVSSLGATKQECTRARAHILLVNGGSVGSILLSETTRAEWIFTMDFSTSFWANNTSVGQVYAGPIAADR
jgi:hypothetical protein